MERQEPFRRAAVLAGNVFLLIATAMFPLARHTMLHGFVLAYAWGYPGHVQEASCAERLMPPSRAAGVGLGVSMSCTCE